MRETFFHIYTYNMQLRTSEFSGRDCPHVKLLMRPASFMSGVNLELSLFWYNITQAAISYTVFLIISL